ACTRAYRHFLHKIAHFKFTSRLLTCLPKPNIACVHKHGAFERTVQRRPVLQARLQLKVSCFIQNKAEIILVFPAVIRARPQRASSKSTNTVGPARRKLLDKRNLGRVAKRTCSADQKLKGKLLVAA